ncbi:hypothetical protein ScPMuIL_014106 [Solemya velum]
MVLSSKYGRTSTGNPETREHGPGGCYISNVGICVLGLVFIVSLTSVGLIVHHTGKRQTTQAGDTSKKYLTYRDYWYNFDQCQTWASSGRLSNHFEKTLVTTTWLADQLSDPALSIQKIRILDTWGKKLYKQDHIPNALFFDHTRCVNSSRLFPRNLPDQGCFEEYLQSLGIHADTEVILYDRYSRRPSARAWWLLRLYGHKRVSVLDGGLKKWKADGHQTTTVLPSVETSELQVDFDPVLIRDFDAMSLNYDYNIEQVIDARLEEFFTGEITEMGLRPGHIPGSINVPYSEMFNSDETFKSANELRRLFMEAGIDLNRPVVATCTTGMKATGTAIAFHLMGKIIPIYHGAWTEWSQRAKSDRIATGKN